MSPKVAPNRSAGANPVARKVRCRTRSEGRNRFSRALCVVPYAWFSDGLGSLLRGSRMARWFSRTLRLASNAVCCGPQCEVAWTQRPWHQLEPVNAGLCHAAASSSDGNSHETVDSLGERWRHIANVFRRGGFPRSPPHVMAGKSASDRPFTDKRGMLCMKGAFIWGESS